MKADSKMGLGSLRGELETISQECSWCGADLLVDAKLTKQGTFFKSRSGELFCCRSHQQASSRALRKLRKSYETQEGNSRPL